MKQVEKISLSSVPFSIEKDAYDKLCTYLADINAHYKDSQGGDEVVDGIEERMAELFKEKTAADGVVTMELVDEVIGRLGRPADIDCDPSEEKPRRNRISKRLYRDKDNSMIFGVCSGLGAYFNIDKAIVRLIFFILFFIGFFTEGIFFGIVLFSYIALAVCMPAAVTVEDRCRMYGNGTDISGIEEQIRYRPDSKPGQYRRERGRSTAESVIIKIIGTLALIIGVGGLISGSLTALWMKMLNDFVAFESESEMMRLYGLYIIPLTQNIWFIILIYTVVLLPFIWMIYEGLKLIFGFKPPKWHPGLVIMFVWMAAIIAALVIVSWNFYDLWYVYNM